MINKFKARCINNEGFESILKIDKVYDCVLPGLPGSTPLENPDDYYFVLTDEIHINPSHDSRIVKRDKFFLVDTCLCIHGGKQYILN